MYYLIDSENVVINYITYDGISAYDPRPYRLVSSDTIYQLGDTFIE